MHLILDLIIQLFNFNTKRTFSLLDQCAENMFRCGDGTCLDLRHKCDGRRDCFDNSDEEKCGKIFSTGLVALKAKYKL